MRSLENSFSIFKNKNNQYLIVYSNKDYVCFYDLLSENNISYQKTNLRIIENVRHFYDSTNQTNYVIVHSYRERILLLFNCDKEAFPIELKFCYQDSQIDNCYSCVMVTIKENTYIITSSKFKHNLNIYNKKGELIKILKSFVRFETLFLSSWNDKFKESTYIINANYIDIKLIDFEKGKLFNTYSACAGKDYYNFWSAFVTYITKTACLIGSDYRGFLRIWDLYSSKIIKSIKFESSPCGIRQWNNRFIIVSDEKNCKITVMDIQNSEYIRLNPSHKSRFGIVEKADIPGYGECIISADDRGEFYLWAI
jgi:WD40 repeat protein